jgi:hypothetical protein
MSIARWLLSGTPPSTLMPCRVCIRVARFQAADLIEEDASPLVGSEKILLDLSSEVGEKYQFFLTRRCRIGLHWPLRRSPARFAYSGLF